MLDLVISSLWLTCSCPFISLSFANCWNAESLWLGVSCQPDRQRWILPNEVWRDLAPCPWTSLFLTFLLCQEGSELCQHSQTYQRPGRLRWNLLLPEPLSLRQHFYSQSTESEGKKKKNPGIIVQKSLFGWKGRHELRSRELLEFWMSV